MDGYGDVFTVIFAAEIDYIFSRFISINGLLCGIVLSRYLFGWELDNSKGAVTPKLPLLQYRRKYCMQ